MAAKLTAIQLRTVAMPMLLKKQGRRCPLCQIDMTKIESKNICVDHNHSNGFLRGVLCRNCNGLEGKVQTLAHRGKKDLSTTEWLRNLVTYLELHETPQSNLVHPTFKTVAEKLAHRNLQARVRRAKKKEATNG